MIKNYQLLLNKYSDKVFYYFLNELHDEDLAQELTQTCFIRLWENEYKDLSESTARSWLFNEAEELKQEKVIPVD